MSFALEYRKKLLAREREARRVARANEGFVSMPADDAADTRGNRARVLLALVIAGGLLAVFNSGGLVQYAYGLTDSQLGRRFVAVAERWHGLMQDRQVPGVIEQIRGSVMMARQTSWSDLATVFSSAPGDQAPVNPGVPPVVPARTAPEPAMPEERAPGRPRMVKPAGPVMRASADGP